MNIIRSDYVRGAAVVALPQEEENENLELRFQEVGRFPEKFSKTGKMFSPELRIEGTPAGSESLALIVDDPAAAGWIITHGCLEHRSEKLRSRGGSVPTGGSREQ